MTSLDTLNSFYNLTGLFGLFEPKKYSDTILDKPFNTNTNADDPRFNFIDLKHKGSYGTVFPKNGEEDWMKDGVDSEGHFNPDTTKDFVVNNPRNSKYKLKLYNGVQPIYNRILLEDPTKRRKFEGESKFNYSDTSFIVDKINASGISDNINRLDDGTVANDLVKFKIGIINRNDGSTTYIHFRANIDSFQDNYNADWSEHRFIGRGEKFYKYNSFNRDINLSFTCVALSQGELIPMYKKLNFLASLLAPDYGDDQFMSGNIVTLTLGGYVYDMPGIIQSMSLDIPEEATWHTNTPYSDESGVDYNDESLKELPMMVKVTGFKFTPIHRFAPRKQREDQYHTGKIRFISLAETSSEDNTSYSIPDPNRKTNSPKPIIEENPPEINKDIPVERDTPKRGFGEIMKFIIDHAR